MKTKILIIEDNECKYFTTKTMLETQLKLEIDVKEVSDGKGLADATSEFNPDMIMFRPNGGVAELLEKMKKRKTNRRNTEITLLVASDLDDEFARRVADFVTNYPKRVANAA